MGFVPKKKIYRLEFESGEYEGLVARVAAVPLGEFMELQELAEGIDGETVAGLSPKEAVETFGHIKKLFSALADALQSWNIEEEDGTPVPADLSGLYKQDFDLAMFLVGEWIGAMGGVSDPLEPKQTGSDSLPDEELMSLLAKASQPKSEELS